MWNAKKSILLSKICVVAFMAAILFAACICPRLVRWLISLSTQQLQGLETFFYLTLYSGCLPALALLLDLYQTLRRISIGEVFVEKNVASLRRISWFCFFGGFICLASGLYYFPFCLVAFAAAFVGLIVRVVKNVFAQAVWLQQEVDGTV